MEIQWKHVFLLIGIIYLLVNLGPILNTLGGTISDILGAFGQALEPLRSYSPRGTSSTFALAKLCVILIFVVGILKLIKSWNKK
ncbi:MAG: hypothetical protein ABSB22_05080 [Thermodesulfobacteriota bacterium]